MTPPSQRPDPSPAKAASLAENLWLFGLGGVVLVILLLLLVLI